MAKVTIAGISVDVDAHRGNTPVERAAIFAHLKGLDKQQAVQQLEQAMKQKPEAPAPPEPKKGNEPAAVQVP